MIIKTHVFKLWKIGFWDKLKTYLFWIVVFFVGFLFFVVSIDKDINYQAYIFFVILTQVFILVFRVKKIFDNKEYRIDKMQLEILYKRKKIDLYSCIGYKEEEIEETDFLNMFLVFNELKDDDERMICLFALSREQVDMLLEYFLVNNHKLDNLTHVPL